ncbi:hypothetical protein T11_1212 [Trichinella zimbabwensis]|uniref:Uncharacterized protein n=1 Tax=Trichinella zimbabwensis TaxID=268475 RepID=A0A0V1EN47_9BILA|nr:hypothetical protein T11_1212 [Trichinella zimbabwensis]
MLSTVWNFSSLVNLIYICGVVAKLKIAYDKAENSCQPSLFSSGFV